MEEKREELDKLAKKAHSHSIAVRTAMLFWIVQHNNHLRRDIDGVGGAAVGKDGEKPNVARTTDEEKRRGNNYDVKLKQAKRCFIVILLARAEADDCVGELCKS